MAFAAAVGLAMPANAQSEQEFIDAFAGDWKIVDARYVSEADLCSLQLGAQAAEEAGHYELESWGCGAEFEHAAWWGIGDGQMIFYDEDGQLIVRLGGNQHRMSGDTAADFPVILERADLAGSAQAIEAAVGQSGCYFEGFTDQCVAESELAMPDDDTGEVNVIVNLNIRAEAREDAAVVGVVAQDQCIATEICTTASDGIWCRAQFDETTGWLRKMALRQGRWPVVTFLNGCPDDG